MVARTKRLTLGRALEILQLRYGTQVRTVRVESGVYHVDSICRYHREFSRADILKIEDEMFAQFGC